MEFYLRELSDKEENEDDDEQLGRLVGALGHLGGAVGHFGGAGSLALSSSWYHCTSQLHRMGCSLNYYGYHSITMRREGDEGGGLTQN